jgi:hypothetical protein
MLDFLVMHRRRAMLRKQSQAKASGSAACSGPDLTNSLAIAFYAAIWLSVAAMVAHIFFRY